MVVVVVEVVEVEVVEVEVVEVEVVEVVVVVVVVDSAAVVVSTSLQSLIDGDGGPTMMSHSLT